MQVHTDINTLPPFKNAVLTIGTFDGVHTGHVKIIEQLKKEASEQKGESIIITFHPHPRMVVTGNNDKPIYLLNTLEEKIKLIATHAIDHLVIVPFTHHFAEISAEDYITKFLVQLFKPVCIIIGHDHHFGKGRQGNYKMLETFAKQNAFCVKEIPQYILDDVTISSTQVRDALLTADVSRANRFLGYNYFFSGSVIHGDKIGRTLGYPTANINITNASKLIPAKGIYIVDAIVNDNKFKGMLSIGNRPTVGGTTISIEVNILDFNQNIYDAQLTVILKKYIRNEIKFNTIEELKLQMKNDELVTRNYFTLAGS